MNRGPTGWRCGWPCSSSCWEVPMSDLILISGGRLMDPGQGLDGVRDILVGKGRVLWIGHGPPPQGPGKVPQGRGLVEFLKDKASREGLVRVLPVGALTRGRVGKELVEMEAMARAGAVAFSDDGHPTGSRIMRQALEFSRYLGQLGR